MNGKRQKLLMILVTITALSIILQVFYASKTSILHRSKFITKKAFGAFFLTDKTNTSTSSWPSSLWEKFMEALHMNSSKTRPAKYAIITAKIERDPSKLSKTEIEATNLAKTETKSTKLAKTETEPTKVAKTEREPTKIAKTKTKLAETETTEVAKPETKPTIVVKTETDPTKLAKIETETTKVAKTETTPTELVKTYTEPTKLTKTETKPTELVKTEIEPTELTNTEQDPTYPVTKPTTKESTKNHTLSTISIYFSQTTSSPTIRTIWDKINDIPVPPKTDKVKIVLYYTTWFGLPYFDPPTQPMDKNTFMFVYPNGTECDFKCRFTYNKSLLHTADAGVFHGNDIPGNIHEMSKNRTNFEQRWVYQTQENAYNGGRDAGNFNGIFNWTMTYRIDSDSPFTYLEYFGLTPEERAKVNPNVNYAEGKTNLVTWSVSHCNTASKRDQVVQKLTEFLPISINGRCAHLFPKRLNVSACGRRHSPGCTQFYKSTKFYLAFENGMCEDYITEKYAEEPLGNGMIPIVFGPQEYYKKLAIPGSYINLFDFPSIEALANYIKYLDKNDTAYNEYFQWKIKYKVFVDRSNYACILCQKLHDDSLPPKVYNDLGSLHGHAQCDKNLPRIKKYLD